MESSDPRAVVKAGMDYSNRHLATCWYCSMDDPVLGWNVRVQFLHDPIIRSRSISLICYYCRMKDSISDDYICYPCGWWELHPRKCICAYLDRFGYELDDGTPILFIPTNFTTSQDMTLLRVTELHIDYILRNGLVKFVGFLGDMVYSDDDHGMLSFSEIMTVKPFRKMRRLAQYFLKHTKPKLHAWRINSLILKSLHFSEIKRLSLVNATTKCLLLSSTGSSQLTLTDATLVSRMSKRGVNSFNPAQPGWQWQQFMNPTDQGKWCYRFADGEWFIIIISDQNTGLGRAGRTWKRYRDPTSDRCFWWRSDDDWGWER